MTLPRRVFLKFYDFLHSVSFTERQFTTLSIRFKNALLFYIQQMSLILGVILFKILTDYLTTVKILTVSCIVL